MYMNPSGLRSATAAEVPVFKTMPGVTLPPVVIDTREKLPFKFRGYAVQVIRGTLATGDYSVAGMETIAAVERKSLADIVGCLTTGRERFARELERGRSLKAFAVIIESNLGNMAGGHYRSRLNPHSALQALFTWQTQYGVPFLFCGTRALAEYSTIWLLHKFHRIHGFGTGKGEI